MKHRRRNPSTSDELVLLGGLALLAYFFWPQISAMAKQTATQALNTAQGATTDWLSKITGLDQCNAVLATNAPTDAQVRGACSDSIYQSWRQGQNMRTGGQVIDVVPTDTTDSPGQWG